MNNDQPSTWEVVRLDDINKHVSKSLNPSNFGSEIFELYSVPSFPSGSPEILEGNAIGSTKQVVLPDDVLICKINPKINRVWKVKLAGQYRQIASSEWIIVRSPELHSDYLRYYFSSPTIRERIVLDVTGVGGSLTRAQPKRVANYPVPIAPLPEQKRIADKLDDLLGRVDTCQAHLDRVPEILKRFRQSVLAAATSGRLTQWWDGHEEEWETDTLGSVITDIRYGTAKKSIYGLENATPVLRIPNIGDGKIDATDLKFAHFEHREVETLSLKTNDLLLIRSNGSVELVGKVAIVDSAFEGYIFAGYLIRLRFDLTKVNPRYIGLYLSSPAIRNHIELNARSTSGVNNINSEEVKAIPLAYPSLEEQHEIVRLVERLFAFADRLEARWREAQGRVGQLTPSLLAKAFRGELVEQREGEESAGRVVERIKAQK